MGEKIILYPLFGMFFLVIVVFFLLAGMRIWAIANGEVELEDFRVAQREGLPERLIVVNRHFINLFEIPVFFYVGVLLTYITHQVDLLLILAAWMYLFLRYAHSVIHLTFNEINSRFVAYLLSNVVLIVLWVRLGWKLVVGGNI